MNMENFITGYPANESAMREAVGRACWGATARTRSSPRSSTGSSPSRMRRSWRRWGVNCVRLAGQPGVTSRVSLRLSNGFRGGFERLSRACRDFGRAPAGSTRVIDLHAVPGVPEPALALGQSDARRGVLEAPALHGARDGAVGGAGRRGSRASEWVAGYNLLNEPADPFWRGRRARGMTASPNSVVREVDPDHILFMDGNTYSTDFSAFGEPVENVVLRVPRLRAGGDGVR